MRMGGKFFLILCLHAKITSCFERVICHCGPLTGRCEEISCTALLPGPHEGLLSKLGAAAAAPSRPCASPEEAEGKEPLELSEMW